MQQLDRDERVVSFADVEGGVVVATPRGLWWPFPGGMRRIGVGAGRQGGVGRRAD